MDSASPTSSFGPMKAKERIDSLDVLRGFALFGVLWVNLEGPSSGSSVDRVFQWACQFLAQNKFMPILACLFGAGLAMQWERIASSGRSPLLTIVRRLLVLWVFGACHTILVWDQDFLTEYAMWGVFLILVLRLPPKAILLVAALVLSAILVRVELAAFEAAARSASSSAQAQTDPARRQEAARRRAAAVQREIETGTWLEHTRERGVGLARGMSRGVTYFPRRPLVLMLIGAWIVRLGLLKPHRLKKRGLRRFAVWSLPLGLAMSAPGFLSRIIPMVGGAGGVTVRMSIGIAGIVGPLLLGLAYASVILLLLQDQQWHSRLLFLAPVGRMALTNYLLQTLSFTWLVYGYGLGFYSLMTPAVQFVYTVVFFGGQIALSRWWLSRYQFGPAEWLWRSLTYAKPQPWRASIVGHV